MATSGSVTTNAYDGRSLTFNWSRASYSVENNTTTITWSLKGSGSQTQWFMSGPFLVRINGAQQYYSSSRIQLKNGTTVASGSYTVQHDSVGWGAFTVYIEAAVYTYSVNVSASQQFVMESIPRATTPSVSGTLKMGNTVTINLPRASSSFTHIVTYSFGSIWDTISSSAGASVQWTIPRSLANQIPNGTSGTLYISAQTISNGQNIGTKQISVTLQVSDSDVPSISSVSVAEAVSGLASKFGFYVQGKSRLSVSISASGIYGSTIQSYSASLNGVNYSGSSFTTDYINASGTLTITVRDSRGRTATTTRSISVTAYSSPVITTLTAARVDSSGVSDEEEGTYLRVNYAFNITALSNKNDKMYTLQYKATTSSSWITLTSGSVYSANSTYQSTSGFLDVDQSYDIQLIVTDYFGSVSAPASVSVAFVLVDYHQSGRGMAIGKVAESADLFDIALKSRFRKNVQIDSVLNVDQEIRANKGIKPQKTNTITSTGADTTSNWGAQNTGVHWYTNTGQLIDQPSQWGYLLNIGEGAEVHQIWMEQASGSVWHRGGNASGWNGSWRRILDSSNLGNYFNSRVVDSGSWGIWEYRRWDNGMVELWGTWTGTINLGENNYSGFRYSNAITVNYPFRLTGPKLWVDRGPSQFIAGARAFGDTETYARFTCYGLSDYSQSNVNIYLYAIGWR